MSRSSLSLAAALVVLASSPAFAEPRLAPMAGVEMGQSHERLTVKLPGYSAQEDRWLWNTSLMLGLSAPIPALGGIPLRADSSLTYGKIIHSGHGRLSLREDLLADLPIGAGFSLLVGPGVAFVINTTQASRSSFDLALPLGIRYKWMELLYRPAASIPLGKEEQPVFGGTRQLSARPGLVPFALVLRAKF